MFGMSQIENICTTALAVYSSTVTTYQCATAEWLSNRIWLVFVCNSDSFLNASSHELHSDGLEQHFTYIIFITSPRKWDRNNIHRDKNESEYS